MSGNLSLHVIRRGELRDGTPYARFVDPEQLAALAPEKRKTLLDCPLAGADDEPVQIIGLQGDRVIGRMDLVPGVVHAAGRAVRILWGSHLTVPVAHRNTLMGVMLIMKAMGLHHTVAASGPSQAVIPVYQKLKWIDMPLPRYIMICRSRPVVERYLGVGIGSTLAAGAADAALKIHRGAAEVLRRIVATGLTADKTDAMSPEFDPILGGVRRPVSAHRSAAWINWQLKHSFTADPRNRQSLYYVRDRGGKVVGYFLNKVRFHETATHRGFKNVMLGSPQDWMIFDPAAATSQEILLLAIRELLRENIHAIDLCTDDPGLRMMLRLLGFMRTGSMRMMFRAGAASPLKDAGLHDLSQWWIRPADGDNFFT